MKRMRRKLWRKKELHKAKHMIHHLIERKQQRIFNRNNNCKIWNHIWWCILQWDMVECNNSNMYNTPLNSNKDMVDIIIITVHILINHLKMYILIIKLRKGKRTEIEKKKQRYISTLIIFLFNETLDDDVDIYR